jgi:hypothetical protein
MPTNTTESTCRNIVGDTCSSAPPEPTENSVDLSEPIDEIGLIPDTETLLPTFPKSVNGVTHLVSFVTPLKNIKKAGGVDVYVNAKAKNALIKPFFGVCKMRVC